MQRYTVLNQSYIMPNAAYYSVYLSVSLQAFWREDDAASVHSSEAPAACGRRPGSHNGDNSSEHGNALSRYATDTHASVREGLAVCQVKQICCRFVISSIHLHFSTTTGVSDCTHTHRHASTHTGRLLLNNCSRSVCVCGCVDVCWTGNGA